MNNPTPSLEDRIGKALIPEVQAIMPHPESVKEAAEWCEGSATTWFYQTQPGYWAVSLSDASIQRIIQAFRDDGWRNNPQVSDGTIFNDWFKKEHGLKTQEEWQQQAIKDGWMSREDLYTIRDGNEQLYKKYGLMTGQEWYDRFTENMNKNTGHVANIGNKHFVEDRAVTAAAKKAAGIS